MTEPEELNRLYQDLLIGVTQFFRDPEAFEAIEREVIPKLLDQVKPDDELRVWIAGCATGEEAYSLAMLFCEAFAARNRPVRLKIDGNRRLTEIETLVAHSENGAKNLEAIGQPRAAFLRPTPPADRASRADLVRVANMYFSGMQLNDGKGTYPFAEDCDRLENGGKTTNAPVGRGGITVKPDPKTSSNYSDMWTCREQFESGLLHFVMRIRDRRYLVVDEERGLVVAFAFFDHDAGASRHFTTPDGRSVTAGPTVPWTWEIAELFKVEKGLLHEIEAILERAPYGMTSGWSSWEDGMSDKIQFAR